MLKKCTEITRVGQEESHDCGAACLSMVTGIPIDDVKEEMQRDRALVPYSKSEVARFLTRHNVYMESCDGVMHTNLMEGGVYFCLGIVPNGGEGGYHAVICKVENSEVIILDPSSIAHEIKITNYYHLTDCSIK